VASWVSACPYTSSVVLNPPSVSSPHDCKPVCLGHGPTRRSSGLRPAALVGYLESIERAEAAQL